MVPLDLTWLDLSEVQNKVPILDFPMSHEEFVFSTTNSYVSLKIGFLVLSLNFRLQPTIKHCTGINQNCFE